MSTIRKAYKTILKEFFSENMTISFGEQKLGFTKRTWTIPDESGKNVTQGLRYGDNPDQSAAMYQWTSGELKIGNLTVTPGKAFISGIDETSFIQFGKHPGKTNITDISSALSIMRLLGPVKSTIIVKHNNPCGVSISDNLYDSYINAYNADRIAAMGGCTVLSHPCDIHTAEAISQTYSEVVVAPEFENGTIELLKKRKNLRIIRIPEIAEIGELSHQPLLKFTTLEDGGIIVEQTQIPMITSSDDFIIPEQKIKGETFRINRNPLESEKKDLILAWHIVSGITSNSIVMVKNGTTVAIGTGEQDRVGAVRLAIEKACTKHADGICFRKYGISLFQMELEVKKDLRPQSHLLEIMEQSRSENCGLSGSVIASDGFFPFRDGVDAALNMGITAVIQPGGSIKDYESIIACNERDATMVFTNQRVFKH
ncbi:MAG: IMP cyclohydrolase [Deltaproteobacteria bacterium]|nr:IMP cyclohydrolase [Deltaproteobacteria bacterium]